MIGSSFQQKIVAIDSPEYIEFLNTKNQAIDDYYNNVIEPEIYDIAQEKESFNIYDEARPIEVPEEINVINKFLAQENYNINEEVVTQEEVQIVAKANQLPPIEQQSDVNEIVSIPEEIVNNNINVDKKKLLKWILLGGGLYLVLK